jgi:hypothetical protein
MEWDALFWQAAIRKIFNAQYSIFKCVPGKVVQIRACSLKLEACSQQNLS